MLTVANASWSQGTQTMIVSPLGEYESVTAARLPWDQRLKVVAFYMVEASGWGGVGDDPGAYSGS